MKTTTEILAADDKAIFQRPLIRKSKSEASASSLHYLFASIISYSIKSAKTSQALEDRQHQIGVRVGERILLLISHREKLYKRDIRILPILSFLSQTCWKFMFGHPGDLYKSSDAENDYMLSDKRFPLLKYCVQPRGEGYVNCAAFGAGLIEGLLCAAEFVGSNQTNHILTQPAKVNAHFVPDSKSGEKTLTFFISFVDEVILREKKLATTA